MRKEEKQSLKLALLAMFTALASVLAIVSITGILFLHTTIKPYREPAGNDAEMRLIENNNKAFEESMLKNCTEDKIYNFNELVPFEWEKVYFINALKEVRIFFGLDYATDRKKIVDKAGYDWGGEIPCLIDYSSPSEHTHILFLNDGKVVAYLPYNFKSKPVIVRLRQWDEGVFEGRNNPEFFVEIYEDNNGDKTFVIAR